MVSDLFVFTSPLSSQLVLIIQKPTENQTLKHKVDILWLKGFDALLRYKAGKTMDAWMYIRLCRSQILIQTELLNMLRPPQPQSLKFISCQPCVACQTVWYQQGKQWIVAPHDDNLALNFCHCQDFAPGFLWLPKLQIGCLSVQHGFAQTSKDLTTCHNCQLFPGNCVMLRAL